MYVVTYLAKHVFHLFVAHCPQGCYNGGTCTSPFTCTCKAGWTGSDCKTGPYNNIRSQLPTQLMYCYYCIYVASTVRFSQTNYSTTEDNGPLQPTVILSDALSTNIIIHIKDMNNTAIGECTKLSRHDLSLIQNSYIHCIYTFKSINSPKSST